MIRNKKVLVTGASGFIGRHLVKELAKYNNEITCLLLPSEDSTYLKSLNLKIHHGNITEKNSLLNIIKSKDYVFHLAAQLGGNDKDKFYLVNFEGTRNLVDACIEQNKKLQRFLFVSSIAVTGPSGKNRIFDEETECNPINDYGRSKLMAEQYLKDQKGKTPFSIVRLAMVYGPGSYGGLYAFFKFMNKRLLPYFGNGCTNISYVEDIVNGMILTSANSNSMYKTYILANKQLFSLKKIQKTISGAIGKTPVKIYVPFSLMYIVAFGFELVSKITKKIPALTRNEIVSYMKHRYWQFDTKKAAEELNYQPGVPLERGIGETYKWYKKNNLI